MFLSKKSIVFFYCIISLIIKLNAQINESDTAQLQLNAVISGIIQTGNVDISIYRAKAEGVFKISSALVFKTQNNALYQTFSNIKTDLDLNSRNYLYFHPEKRIYPFAMLYAQSNYRLKIEERIFYGIGVSIQIIQKQHHNFKISASWVYENSLYSVTRFNEMFYQGQSTISIHRPTFYLSGLHRISSIPIYLNYVFYAQSGIERVENYRLHAESSLEFKLFKSLSFSTQLIYLYEKVTAFGIKQSDVITTFGIQYRFKK